MKDTVFGAYSSCQGWDARLHYLQTRPPDSGWLKSSLCVLFRLGRPFSTSPCRKAQFFAWPRRKSDIVLDNRSSSHPCSSPRAQGQPVIELLIQTLMWVHFRNYLQLPPSFIGGFGFSSRADSIKPQAQLRSTFLSLKMSLIFHFLLYPGETSHIQFEHLRQVAFN